MRGQVTLFVIIGIVILLVVGVVYYYRDNIISGLRGDASETVSQALEEQQIRDYVQGCVFDLASEAIDVVGLQGGYILIPLDIGVNEINNVVVLGDLNIPLWFYDKENNIQRVNVPELEDIENEIRDYIDINLDRCTTYKLFSDYTIKEGLSSSDVKIKNSVVEVDVKFPVNIKTEKGSFTLDKFNVEVDSPLGELYQAARNIFDRENEIHELEERTFDMMVLYDEIPVSGTDFECGVKVWNRESVEQDLKEIIVNNIPYMKIKGTEHGSVEKYRQLDLLGSSVSDLHASLMYLPDWQFYFDVFPDEDGVLRSDNVLSGNQINQFLMGIACVNSYNFVYDVKYPVVVVLDKDGYIFQFGMEVILDNNQPRENQYETIGLDNQNEVCNIREKEVEIFVTDNSGNNIGGRLYYRCGGYSCSLGEVEEGYLKTEFPSCYNGEVIVRNDDYTEGHKEFSSNKETIVNLVLRPLHEFNYKIRLVDKATGIIKDVEDEQILLNLETGDYSEFITQAEGSIKLVDGNYEVSAKVFDDTGVKFKVEEREIENCVDVPKGWIGTLIGITEEKCVSTTMPETEVEQMLIGGNNFNWGIDRGELFESEQITFYIIVDRRPKNVEELGEVYDSLEGNDESRFFLYPELK